MLHLESRLPWSRKSIVFEINERSGCLFINSTQTQIFSTNEKRIWATVKQQIFFKYYKFLFIILFLKIITFNYQNSIDLIFDNSRIRHFIKNSFQVDKHDCNNLSTILKLDSTQLQSDDEC